MNGESELMKVKESMKISDDVILWLLGRGHGIIIFHTLNQCNLHGAIVF